VKRYLIYIILLLPSRALCQDLKSTDTVYIGEVVISRSKPDSRLPGFKKFTVESEIPGEYSLSGVADVLAENSAIFVKSYGLGGSATPSLRGTGASNTKVAWNGIKLENPMLGQTDLSLLPFAMTDRLHISYGGASMEQGSGTAGGIISLENLPCWKQPLSVTFMPSAASFGTYSFAADVRKGSETFSTMTRAYLQSAENDFTYLNKVYGPEPFSERRKNSQAKNYGIMQELYFMRSENILSARVWYQRASRNLPSSLLSLQSANRESQDDEALRVMLDYNVHTPQGNLFVTGAWLMNRLDYFNYDASIDSRNLSGTWIARAGMRDISWKKFKIDLLINEELNNVNSGNYQGRKSRNSADLTAIVRSTGYGMLNGSLLFREILHGNRFLVPDFSAGLSLKPLKESEYYLKASISRSSRVPSMNDLFWSPGGNPDLVNEYAIMPEVGIELKDLISTSVNLDLDASIYRNSIRNMIQWRPGEFSWWTASNIGHVYTSGVETSAKLKYSHNRMSSAVKAVYAFTRATEAKSGEGSVVRNQLVYVPRHQFNASLHVRYGKIHAGWKVHGNGVRYTVTDNSKHLPAYMVNGFSIGSGHIIMKGTFQADFEIENIFNEEYQTIAWYPLPGRSYNLRLMFQFKTIDNE
jgi:outer membrane receptor protein involved in Fe transport